MPVPRGELASKLRGRRLEIEQAFLARATSLPSTELCDDPEYLEGFRSAVSAAVDYCLAVVDGDEGDPPPIPDPIIEQARLAARYSVSLPEVVRRYIACAHLFDCFVLEQLDPAEWGCLHRLRAEALDRLLSAVSAAYERERTRPISRSGAAKLDCAQKLLNGELVDSATLEYGLDQSHVALIAKGREAADALRRVAKQADCNMLCVPPDEETTWAWLGRTQRLVDSRLTAALSSSWDMSMPLAIGEEHSGLSGWRESHRQARDVLLITQRGISPIARYRRDALLASVLRDEVLASSLWSRFISPLLARGTSGDALLRTLRAYLEANGNGASAAATLGVTRQTVGQRLGRVEELTGTRVATSSIELALALRLHDAGYRPAGHQARPPAQEPIFIQFD